MAGNVVRSQATIVSDLRRLGIRAGDLLMVHASLRAVGPVEDGARGVLAALRTAVGPDGTLLMVLGARDDGATAPFDPLTTPAEPEVGMLAEVFRTQPDTRVSDHPEGRFGAAGPLAEALTTDVPWNDYYGPGSPLERLVQQRGRILRLGADPETVTLYHYGEYLARLPSKRRVRRHRWVHGPDGPKLRVVECLDDCDGIVEYSGDDYFGVILKVYLAAGRGLRGTVGRAASELLDAADALAFAVEWMEENLAP